MAENETLFRDVNERVNAIASVHGDDDHVYEFFCECSNVDCTLHVPTTLGTYERVRADATHFLVTPEHSLPEIERVVEKADDWWVIEKFGEAKEIAEESDPRDDG